MQRGRWKKIVGLLEKLRELAPAEQESFLVGIAADDPPLRQEIDSLMEAHPEARSLDDLARVITGSEQVPSSPPSQLSAAQQIGPYRVIRKIGRGGMGEVYEAQDTRLQRRVALKLLAFEATPGDRGRERLLREARAASALNHPNIVTIYSIEQFEDLDYIVMEYVDGSTLTSKIERGQLTFEEMLEAGIQIATALEAAHSIGVIHRDVKPANVLVTPWGQIKLLDFGLAKRVTLDGETARHSVSARLAADGTILGTVAYMSPEQTRGEPLDPRTDIFSLGTVLYEAATGRLPFQGPSALYVMHEIAVANPTPPDVLDPDIPPQFSPVILRALAKRKGERFASAAEIAGHLRKLREGSGATPRVQASAPAEPAPRESRRSQSRAASSLPPQRSGPGSGPADYLPGRRVRSPTGYQEGERKRVTILVCEVADADSADDVEQRHDFLNLFFEVAAAEVSRYEGVINQFREEGFVALLGAPIAQEHHARRAVLAASGLRRRLGRESLSPDQVSGLGLCTGVNSGEVIVGSTGADSRMNYTPVGDTARAAGTLQERARGGQILISDTTRRLVEGYCTTRSLEHSPESGEPGGAETWEVLDAPETRTRLEAQAERGLTPFVGRERELRLLEECFERVEEGQGQIVFLVGEAGIGKSRILREFERRVQGRATWNEADAMSFGQSMAFHPLIDLLKRKFQIEEGDSEEVIIEKATGDVLAVDADLGPILPYLRYLLGVDPGDSSVGAMDPKLRHAELFAALQQMILTEAQASPQIVLFEDLHWIDRATEDFLVLTADSIPSSRVMCLFTYRPDYVHPFGDRTYHSRIALGQLSRQDTLNMTQAMLDAERLPRALERLIVQKAEGNPFFVEEVVRSLRETGAITRQADGHVLTRPLEEIRVPDGIREILMARIDRLEEGPKRTLQLASVIGREFRGRLLGELAGSEEETESSIRELKATELILEKRLFPEATYLFGHALTQEVAYSSLLQRHRKELHRGAGEVIERL